MSALLNLDAVTRRFGGVAAVNRVSLGVEHGELLAIIGPNGAGKTTLFNIICNLTPASEGRVLFAGKDITGWAPHRVVRAGIARTFQTPRPFTGLNVLENVMVALDSMSDVTLASAVLRPIHARRDNARTERKAWDLLEAANLGEHAQRQPQSLPLGLQRKLEVVRALATGPKVLLLDEPGAGLGGSELDALVETIRFALDRDVAVVWIEHQLDLVMRTAGRVHVLDRGSTICEGPPSLVQSDERVRVAYIGRRALAAS